MRTTIAAIWVIGGLALGTSLALAEPPVRRTQDVIYGKKNGMALTLDVFTPTKPNGAAIVAVMSGGWFSDHSFLDNGFAAMFVEPLTQRGYTVFCVVHGSQPKFTIPEAVDDVNRAVRFIRANAERFSIDADRIGICGASAGGHLSLMQGMAGDLGTPDSKDPVKRASSRVQAVACFYPPTDFLNYGQKDNFAFKPDGTLRDFRVAADVRKMDQKTKRLEHVSDEEFKESARKVSPLVHVTSDDPPTLILHGDKDALVPIQQAEALVAKLKELNIPAELVVKKGASHGWNNQAQDMKLLADWFDKHLQKK